MPTRTLTPKQQAFCHKYIETGNASEAYRDVYDCSKSKLQTVSRKAKELLDNCKITAQINELRGSHQQRHEITIDVLSAQLDEDRQFARQRGHSAAAVSATMGKARLFGFLNKRPENANEPKIPLHIEEVSREEKARIIAAAFAGFHYSKIDKT